MELVASVNLFLNVLCTQHVITQSAAVAIRSFGALGSQDSSVGRALGYGLKTGVRFAAGDENFSLRHCVLTGSGAHPASYPMGTGVFSPEVKRPGREADLSPPPSAEVKNAWNCMSAPAIHLHGVVLLDYVRLRCCMPV
jgi:hypothetical protein